MNKIDLSNMSGAELKQLIADAEKQLTLVKPTQIEYSLVVAVKDFETRVDDASDEELLKDTIHDILSDELRKIFPGVTVHGISRSF